MVEREGFAKAIVEKGTGRILGFISSVLMQLY